MLLRNIRRNKTKKISKTLNTSTLFHLLAPLYNDANGFSLCNLQPVIQRQIRGHNKAPDNIVNIENNKIKFIIFTTYWIKSLAPLATTSIFSQNIPKRTTGTEKAAIIT